MSDIGAHPVGVGLSGGRISVLTCGTAGAGARGTLVTPTRSCACASRGELFTVTCRHTEISNSTSLGEKWLQAEGADLDGICCFKMVLCMHPSAVRGHGDP